MLRQRAQEFLNLEPESRSLALSAAARAEGDGGFLFAGHGARGEVLPVPQWRAPRVAKPPPPLKHSD